MENNYGRLVSYPGMMEYMKENYSLKRQKELYKDAKELFNYPLSARSFKSYMNKVSNKIKKNKDFKPKLKNETPTIISIPPQKEISIIDLVNILKKNQVMSFTSLCNNFDISPKKLEYLISSSIDSGYQIFLDDQKVIFNIDRVSIETEKIYQLEDKEIVVLVMVFFILEFLQNIIIVN